ncbi:metal-dependent hydrolase family protein [Sulfobacillus thermosulfidooxidans]|uniref:metal-dependent hydrolase family protein n=1 Tax=Sulfobacillus thermosulfidooxidans TaxID=28034 RepID=UPI0006B557C1|nr:amidohydrolase family protein [Sulfobacillus thermosulfidooxidans]
MEYLLYNIHLVDVSHRQVRDEPWALVWDHDGIIRESGPEKIIGVRFPHATRINGQNRYVLPGFIDCHVHFSAAGHPNKWDDLTLTVPEMTARALVHARRTLFRGITSVRDAGSPFGIGVGVRRAIEHGWHEGPHMRVAGTPFSITGGHADPANGFPAHIHWEGGAVVDSPDDARKEARRQLREGVDVLKFMASGGVMSTGDKSTERGLLLEEMAAAVAEAKNRGKKTMAHAQAQEGIENALKAGVDSIEHGFYLSDWAIEEMIKREVTLVATLTAVQQIIDHGVESGIAPASVEKAKIAREAHQNSLQRAFRAGVRFAMGTDAGTPFNYHGDNAQEIRYLLEVGLNIWDALEAATIHGAELLDIPTGVIAPGFWADLVLWPDNPIERPATLWTPTDRHQVIKKGELLNSKEGAV